MPLAVMVGRLACQGLCSVALPPRVSPASKFSSLPWEGRKLPKAVFRMPAQLEFPCGTSPSSVAVKGVTIHGMVVRHVN